MTKQQPLLPDFIQDYPQIAEYVRDRMIPLTTISTDIMAAELVREYLERQGYYISIAADKFPDVKWVGDVTDKRGKVLLTKILHSRQQLLIFLIQYVIENHLNTNLKIVKNGSKNIEKTGN